MNAFLLGIRGNLWPASVLFMCISWELGFQVLGQRVAGSEVQLAGGQLRHLEPRASTAWRKEHLAGVKTWDAICPDNTEQTSLLTTAQDIPSVPSVPVRGPLGTILWHRLDTWKCLPETCTCPSGLGERPLESTCTSDNEKLDIMDWIVYPHKSYVECDSVWRQDQERVS